jgi:hypothetical protein
MGILTDLFVASATEIDDALVKDGPADRFPTVEAKSADDIKLTSLNGISTGRSSDIDDGGFDELSAEIPLIRHAGDEGPWVFQLPTQLLSAVAVADPERLTAINEEWAQTEEWQLDGVADPEDTRWLVDELARLARDAQANGKNVYLWVSL